MFYLSHSGYDYSQKRCVDASRWFMNQYLPRHNVDVNVHHCRLEKRENVYGWAWTVDCDYRISTALENRESRGGSEICYLRVKRN